MLLAHALGLQLEHCEARGPVHACRHRRAGRQMDM